MIHPYEFVVGHQLREPVRWQGLDVAIDDGDGLESRDPGAVQLVLRIGIVGLVKLFVIFISVITSGRFLMVNAVDFQSLDVLILSISHGPFGHVAMRDHNHEL